MWRFCKRQENGERAGPSWRQARKHVGGSAVPRRGAQGARPHLGTEAAAESSTNVHGYERERPAFACEDITVLLGIPNE